ncbi:MAG TPA: HEPN/Toprim-associated domain-containing protein, partial [Solirubrobacteraceae bacterium]|nr:HEPN/Toprim-associated domain-containing protein [Solirubrobacteraceae bacterium]
MGSYSTLAIGEVSLSWKYEVPTYLTFLFREQDLYIEREEALPLEPGEVPHPPEDYEIRRAGFRTTVAAARKALDGHGYTLDFFAGIYDSFLPDVEEEVREVLEEELGSRAGEGTSAEEIERQAAAHLAAPPPTALGDLEAFVAFLKSALASDFRMPPFIEALEDSPWL